MTPDSRDPPVKYRNFRTGRGLTLLPVGWGAMLIAHSFGTKGFGIVEAILGTLMLVAGIALFVFFDEIMKSDRNG